MLIEMKWEENSSIEASLRLIFVRVSFTNGIRHESIKFSSFENFKIRWSQKLYNILKSKGVEQNLFVLLLSSILEIICRKGTFHKKNFIGFSLE